MMTRVSLRNLSLLNYSLLSTCDINFLQKIEEKLLDKKRVKKKEDT